MKNSSLIENFIHKHQYKLYGYIFNRITIKEDTEDIFQATMEKAILKLNSLQNITKLNSWILSIATNEINSYFRKQSHVKCIDEISIGVEYEYQDFDELIVSSINLLSNEQKEVLLLRFYNDLSYKEISLVCNISEKKVKSRLYEAKKHIKTKLPNLFSYTDRNRSYFTKQKEKIIMDVKSVEIGSYVFARLSLEKQIELCRAAVNNNEFSNELLKEIGKIKNGKEFILKYHSKIVLKELAGILGYCDRFTEMRVIQELEVIEPNEAESIKSSMFVFEDMVLADSGLIKELFNRVDIDLAAMALSSTDGITKRHILNSMDIEKMNELKIHLSSVDVGWEEGLKAQQEIIEVLKEMDISGEVEVKSFGDLDKEKVQVVLRNRS